MKFTALALALGATMALAGCAEDASEAMDTGESASALTTTEWYYACNATSYNLDARSRMQLVDHDGKHTLTFTVDPGENLTDYNCHVVQRTIGDYGQETRTYFGSRTGALTVPNAVQLSSSSNAITVNYGARGTYKATVQAAYGSLTVERVQ